MSTKLSTMILMYVVTIVVFLSGCYPWCKSIWVCKTSYLRKGNIWVEGNHYFYLNTSRREYHRIYVGSPDAYAKALPALHIELCNGERIQLSTVTPDSVREIENVHEDSGMARPELAAVYWPDSARYFMIRCPEIEYVDFAYSFAVLDDRIIGFIAYGEACPGIWNEDLTKRYEFPLEYEEVVELFGEPDEIIEYFGK